MRPIATRITPTRILPGLAIAALAASCAATFEPAEIAPTPQRPKISKDTQTTAKDTLEFEAGIHWDPNDFFDTPVTVKYGAKDDLEFFLQTSVLRVYEFPGGIDPRIPGAFSGATDVRLAGMVEQKTGDLSLNGYVALNSLGVPGGGTSYQTIFAGHVATPVNESDSVFLELVGTFTEGISSQFLGQAGFYRRIAANMTADAAFGIGLDSDSPAFYVMLGLTTNFGYVR